MDALENATTAPTSSELAPLLESFSPSQPTATRLDAYRLLNTLHDRWKDQLVRPAIAAIEQHFRKAQKKDSLSALGFITAIFHVDSASAVTIFGTPGIMASVMDCADIWTTSGRVQLAVCSVLSQASAQKLSRELVITRCQTWIERSAHQEMDKRLQACAAAALTKLVKAPRDEQLSSGAHIDRTDELLSLLTRALAAAPDTSSSTDVVEGLAYITTDSRAKDALARDSNTLATLFALVPARATDEPPPSLIMYGVAAIIANVSAYRPKLTEEESRIAELHKMARGAASKTAEPTAREDPLEADEAVRARCATLVAAGAVDVLGRIVRQSRDSARTPPLVSAALLALVDDRASRGRALQQGVTRSLLALLGRPGGDHVAAQALAKLAITASPVQVFGPDVARGVGPLVALACAQNAKPVQTLEALMALTNIASGGADAAVRVARAQGLLARAETLLLDNQVPLRRAAAELVGNLVGGAEDAFTYFSLPGRAHVLLALSDAEDAGTVRGAAGAIALLAADPAVCAALAKHDILINVLAHLLEPEEEAGALRPELVHRGAVLLQRLMEHLPQDEKTKLAKSVDEAGVTKVLVTIVKECKASEPVQRAAAVAIKEFVACGLEVQVG